MSFSHGRFPDWSNITNLFYNASSRHSIGDLCISATEKTGFYSSKPSLTGALFMLTINSGFTYSQRHTWSSPRCRTRRAKKIYKIKTEIDWWSQIGVTGGEHYIRNTNIITCNLIYCAVHKVSQTVHAYVAQTEEEGSSTQKGQFSQLQLHKNVLLLQLTGIVVKTEISTKAVILYATTRQVTPRQGTDRMGSGSTKPTAINPSESQIPITSHKSINGDFFLSFLSHAGVTYGPLYYPYITTGNKLYLTK